MRIQTLSFGLSYPTRTNLTLISLLALSRSVFGTRFDRWTYGAPVSRETKQRLEQATSAQWNCTSTTISPRILGAETLLNFSGGFDSLAALALMGESTPLVSIDFGERFLREREFYKEFNPAIVQTNAREFETSWTFMGAGGLLMADYFSAGYMSFGSILEASPWGFVSRKAFRGSHPIFKAVDVEETNPLAGITEFGTAKLAATAFPELVVASLESLADPHTEKYLRKSLLLSMVAEPSDLLSGIGGSPSSAKPMRFGENFAADFLAPGLWMFSNKAEQWMSKPAGFDQWAKNMDLNFYMRELPNVMRHPVAEVDSAICKRKREFGMYSYSANDWDELRSVLRVLSFFHKFPGQTW
ncbi:hypothetical protein ACKFRZ_03695 [Corynebacterium gottingense]|uniref:hypothetical protein n=1 Tax=Corynebacterium gottingense TaxID=2041036 RepID=UPI0038CFC84A